MAETKQDIHIEKGVWTSLNTAGGVAIGTAFSVLNKGSTEVLLAEKSTQPTDSERLGIPLTTMNSPYANVEILSGSLEVWAKAVKSSSVLNIS
tara:strand:- start:7506 stop:7784 length:279 start_codon:yes stop_codon:yes gene_type:complete